MTRLGRYFKLEEFHCSDGTRVPDRAVQQLRELVAAQLDPLRDRFGKVTVVSGFRTAAVNKRVGGAVRSFHRYDLRRRYGVAADVVCARGTPSEWADFAEHQGAGGVGRYATFVHIDNRRGTARWRG